MSANEKDVQIIRGKVQNWLMAEGWGSLISLTPIWHG